MVTKRSRNLCSQVTVASDDLNDPDQVELMMDIPDITPEQWAWIKSETVRFEQGYESTSTSTLIDGL